MQPANIRPVIIQPVNVGVLPANVGGVADTVSHSHRGCLVPARAMRVGVLDVSPPDSRGIFVDLCNGNPEHKLGGNLIPATETKPAHISRVSEPTS